MCAHSLCRRHQVDESKFQTPTKVKNGKTFACEFEAAADHQHVWYFRTEKHDIEFSAEFVPAAAPATPVIITAKRKVERHEAGFQVCVAGVRVFTLMIAAAVVLGECACCCSRSFSLL